MLVINRIKDLLEMNVELVEKDLCDLAGCYYIHIPEVYGFPRSKYAKIEAEGIEIRYIKDHHVDVRRVWQLGVVYMDDEPVMVIQNAGREGDDHSQRFIIDIDRYNEMLKRIQAVVPPDQITNTREEENTKVFSLDEEIPELTEFYGYSIGALHFFNG